MSRFIDEADRHQGALLPGTIDEYVSEENPVRAIDAFVSTLDIRSLGFQGADPKATGRPGYHSGTMLKIYLYGYLNRIQSSRRLEQEARRNLELMWLVGRLAPDFKTIADFRRDNGPAIRQVCIHFVRLCGQIGLFEHALVAIDGSKFKAVNNRDKNFTARKLDARKQQLDTSVERYLAELDRADRDPGLVSEERSEHLRERIAKLQARMKVFDAIGQQLAASADEQISLTDPDARSMATSGRGTGIVGYNVQASVDAANCPTCLMRSACTTSKYRRIGRWEREEVFDRVQQRLDQMPDAGRIRRQTVEHAFGTLKAWMGATHFLTKTLPRVRTEMSLHVLAYNLKRVMQMIGVRSLIEAIRAA